MEKRGYTRRDFFRTAGAFGAMAAFGRIPTDLFAGDQRLVRFPEKRDMILLTSRPPNLETPVRYFRELITPNDVVFVRWHIANVPTSVNLDEWRLSVGGHTEKPHRLSMEDLKKFEKVTYTAVIQCSGNGRSFFEPKVPGGQWGNGAMGNITWGGARLKDILSKAGMKEGAVDVVFDGLDTAPLPKTPDFLKSLPAEKAMEEDVMIAYEMNGEPLPMLNGFPARLVVPGHFATYWVKSLHEITVLPKKFEGFWMDPAYRIPDTACACVPPGAKPKKTVPITRMNTRSLIVTPSGGERLPAGRPTEIMGIAFSGGYSIRDVIFSHDGGKTWAETRLGQDKGRNSWIQWFHTWKPAAPGKHTLMARATNSIGESQPMESLWNPSGYMWNKIEKIEVTVA